MKKIINTVALLLVFTASLAQAEPKTVECSKDASFAKNTCDVCYEDTFTAKETPEGWSSTLTDVTIPWKHAGGEKDEIIYDKDQEFPEIISTLTVSNKPEAPKDLWKNHETLIWKPFDDHKEFVIKKGEEVGLYRLAQDASITIKGKKTDDTILFSTPLLVGSFNTETNEETKPEVRNICVLGKFTIQKGPTTTPTKDAKTPEVDTVKAPDVAPEAGDTAASIEKSPETTETTETAPTELNSAGPEPVVTATAEQTKTKSGPEVWIFLLLAFVFASSWNAWKKQKI